MRLRGAWKTFISSRALQAANGAARPCLVGLQLRGVERLPREGVGVSGPETEGAEPTRRGDGSPDRAREPRPARALGSWAGRMPYAGRQGPRPALWPHAGRGGPPQRIERVSALRHPDRPRSREGRLRAEDPRLQRPAIPRVLAQDPRSR